MRDGSRRRGSRPRRSERGSSGYRRVRRQERGEHRSSLVVHAEPSTAPLRYLARERETEALMRRTRLCRETLFEDLLAERRADAGTRIADAHADAFRSGLHRDFDPSWSGRARDGVDGVVDEVTNDGDEVSCIRGIRRKTCLTGEPELDAPLVRDRGLGQEQRGQRGIADPLVHEVDELLVHEGRPSDEADRFIGTAELDETGDRMQLVRKLVRLRAERVREAANAVELAENSLELGPVAERDDGADRLASDDGGHAVRDEDAVSSEQHLIGAATAAGQDKIGRASCRERGGVWEVGRAV